MKTKHLNGFFQALCLALSMITIPNLHAQNISSDGREIQQGVRETIVYNHVSESTNTIEFILILKHMDKVTIEEPTKAHWTPEGVRVEENCDRQVTEPKNLPYWYQVIADERLASEAFVVRFKGTVGSCEGGTGGGGQNTFEYTLVKNKNTIEIRPENKVINGSTWLMLEAYDIVTNNLVEVQWQLPNDSAEYLVLSSTSGGNSVSFIDNSDEDERWTENSFNTVWFKSERGGAFEINARRTVYEDRSELEFRAKSNIDVFNVTLIPASTVIEKIPNIPRNGVLPESLSGTGEKNQVAMQLKVEGPDGYYTFNLSIENGEQATGALSSEQITVQVAHPGGELPQSHGVGLSDNIIVTGGELSSDNEDYVTIKAGSSYNGFVLECDVELLVYKFEFESHFTGSATTAFDNWIRGDMGQNEYNFAMDIPLENFINNMNVNINDLHKRAYATSNDWSYIVTNPTLQPGSLEAKWANFKLEFGGGVTSLYYPQNNADGELVLYTRSSYGGIDVSESLVGGSNMDGSFKEGNIHEKIFIKDERGMPFWGFFVKIADGQSGLNRLAPQGLAHFGRRLIQPDFDLWASDKFVGKEHKTGTNNHSAYIMITRPHGDNVFKGLVSSNVTVKREYEYDLSVRSHYGALNTLLTIGGMFEVPVPGTNTNISLTSAYNGIGGEGEDVTSIAAFSTNMVMVIPSTAKRVNRAGEVHFLENLLVPLNGYVQAENKPRINSSKINATFWNQVRSQRVLSQNDPHPPMLCNVDDEIAFYCQTDEPTKIVVGTSSNTGATKGSKLNFAFSILGLSEIEISTNPSQEGYHFKIWEIQE